MVWWTYPVRQLHTLRPGHTTPYRVIESFVSNSSFRCGMGSLPTSRRLCFPEVPRQRKNSSSLQSFHRSRVESEDQRSSHPLRRLLSIVLPWLAVLQASGTLGVPSARASEKGTSAAMVRRASARMLGAYIAPWYVSTTIGDFPTLRSAPRPLRRASQGFVCPRGLPRCWSACWAVERANPKEGIG